MRHYLVFILFVNIANTTLDKKPKQPPTKKEEPKDEPKPKPEPKKPEEKAPKEPEKPKAKQPEKKVPEEKKPVEGKDLKTGKEPSPKPEPKRKASSKSPSPAPAPHRKGSHAPAIVVADDDISRTGIQMGCSDWTGLSKCLLTNACFAVNVLGFQVWHYLSGLAYMFSALNALFVISFIYN